MTYEAHSKVKYQPTINHLANRNVELAGKVTALETHSCALTEKNLELNKKNKELQIEVEPLREQKDELDKKNNDLTQENARK